jgi:diguanylate cyclase (GGDEF)-like protein
MNDIHSLARVAAVPFFSFSDAVDAVLTLLAEQMPEARIVLSRLEYEEDEYQVVATAGAAQPEIDTGFRMRLQASLCQHMVADDAPRLTEDAAQESAYQELPMTQELGIRAYVVAPLELADGSRVGGLEAMAAAPGVFGTEQLAVLTVTARLLAYEWERVAREVTLRRLVAEQRDRDTTDALTGLPNRKTFMSQLERELELVNRGSVESYLVISRFQVDSSDSSGDPREPERDLMLKDAADALRVTARRTDIVGRVGADEFAAILVGCKGEEGATAFCTRFDSALKRLIRGRQSRLTSSTRIRSLSSAVSPAELVEAREPVPGS